MNMWAGTSSLRPIRMALESRLMLDAAALPAALAGATLSADRSGTPTSSDAAPATAARPPSAVVFAFSDVTNWQDIAAAAPANARVEVIGANEDGLARMAQVLSGMSDVDSVHVISHGEAGALLLGSTVIDAAAVASHSDDLRIIGAALSADADILFYGCDSGSGGTGLALAHALADASGADIALSSDPTGATARGGDWVLETTAGTVETAALSAPGWDAVLAQTTATVDVPDAGGAANGAASALSSNGQFVAFTSSASNLVANDTNGLADVFLRNTTTGTTTRVNLGIAGAQATGGGSTVTDISDDGRFVVFSSTATNLVAGDSNGVEDVFVRDTQTNTTTRVSVNSAGVQANGASSGGSISADGNRVVFASTATNLIAAGDTVAQDIYLRNLNGGPNSTTRISGGLAAANGNGVSSDGVISADGSTVAFASTSSNLVAGDTNGVSDVFVYDIQGGSAARVSVNSAGQQGTGASLAPSISRDGHTVAFATSSAFDGTDTNGISDIYLRDGNHSTTSLISRSTGGTIGNGASTAASLSSEGDYVAFTSSATNLVSGDSNGAADVFVHDIAKNQTLRVSVASSGAQGNGASDNGVISPDGGKVAFRSLATNLAGSDSNGVADIFLASGYTVTPTDQGATPGHNPGPGAAPAPAGQRAERAEGPAAQPPATAPSAPPPPMGETAGAMGVGGLHAPGMAGLGWSPMAAGDQGLRQPPAERLSMLGQDGLSMADRRGLLQGLPNGTIIDSLRASGEPAARVAAALMERVQNGETVSVAEAKAALAAEGASKETTIGLLLALNQVEKSVRTEKLAGALHSLNQDAAAADAFAKAETAPLRDITLTGNRVALLIGEQNYGGGLASLATPAADVSAVSKVLAERFGYQTIVANDASKAEIVDLIRAVGERLDGQGGLIVYYAGHGYAVDATGEGYWLPAGARTDSANGWISTSDLSLYLGQIKANQILVVSDSCYSGALTRQMRLTSDAVGEPREQIISRRSVTAMSSGGDEPVNDGGGNGHSVFAAKLLDVLDGAKADAMGFQLFAQVRNEVTQTVPQEPTYGGLEAAGHAGRTDFVIGGR